jgi:hypothetical protein
MTVNSNIAKRWMQVLSVTCSALLSGCLSVAPDQKAAAIRAVNDSFCPQYEKILEEKNMGTRVFRVRRADAFNDMRVALRGLNLRTESQDVAIGDLVVAGTAPLPLSGDEWQTASQADLPLLRSIVEPYVGWKEIFVHFEPQGLETVIHATFADSPQGTSISLTARLRELAPPPSGWPRRECLSPNVVRSGLDKIWGAFEQELRAGPRRP